MNISFIIPMFNARNTIIRTINSILNQEYYGLTFEIICIDDGSNDDTIHLVKNIKDSKIRLICKENGGTASARNRGLCLSKGDYISFVDADDYISDDFFRSLKGVIYKSADVIQFNLIGRKYKIIENNIPETILLYGSVCNKIFSSWLFEKNRFLEDAYMEDIVFLYELLLTNFSLTTIENQLYYVERSLTDNKMSLITEEDYWASYKYIKDSIVNKNNKLAPYFLEVYLGAALNMNKGSLRVRLIKDILLSYGYLIPVVFFGGIRKYRRSV